MNETKQDEGSPIVYPSAAQGWWTTAVFFVLYALSFIDRQMLNLLVEPIKATLGASDLEISLLQGLTFAIFYTVFGIGIGWLVDNKPRRPIVLIGVLLWSVAATGCGMATRYWHLALARTGVAVGEASLAPAAYSLMSDSFPARRLALPMSVMGAGASLGGAFALIIGSYILGLFPEGIDVQVIGHLEGWQIAFIAVGLPGLLVAPLVLTVVEPKTKRRSAGSAKGASAVEVLQHINRHKGFYWGHFLGFGFYSMINYAMTAWLPTFLIRRHGWELGQAGYATGVLVFVFSMSGSLLMGFLVDRWFATGRKDAHMRFFAGCALLQVVSVAGAIWAPTPWLALALLVPQVLVSSFTGVAAAALQISTPARMRGQMSAIYLLVFNLLGMGLGPSSVAVFSDFLFQDEARVGSSILLTYVIFAPVAIACMLVAGSRMSRQVDAVAAGQ